MNRLLDARTAADDLKRHSLLAFPDEISQLVYLAGTRDYNTGRYYHDGLALRYTQEVANQALASCHQEMFQKLSVIPLEDLVKQLDGYIKAHDPGDGSLLDTWSKLELYRITVPLACDPLQAQFFCSNLRIALAILESRAKNRPRIRRCA